MWQIILLYEMLVIALSTYAFSINYWNFDMFTYKGLKIYTDMNIIGIVLLLLFYIAFAHWVYIAMFVYWICHLKLPKK